MTRLILKSFLTTWLALSALGAWAQDFDRAAASAKADLDKALSELNAVTQQIAAEKLPLSKRFGELEDQILTKRREFDRIQRLRGSKLFDLDSLKAELKQRKDESNYLTSLLDEYARSFEARVHISELQRYRGTIDEAKLAIQDVNLTPTDKFVRQVAVVRASMKRIETLLGGDTFEGSALSAAGKLEKGKFAVIGPITVFAADQSADAGVSELQMGSTEPSVIDIGEQYRAQIKKIVTTGSGELPVDASLGSAIRIAGTRETLVEHMKKGGPVMGPILLLALAAALIALVKWIQLMRVPHADPEDLHMVLDHLNKGQQKQAMEYASKVKGPAGGLLRAAVENAHERKELIEEILYEKLLATKPKLERLLPFIAVTAAAEPLLGLLGTVTGIIRTFKLITVFGTGDPKLLSSGISEALVTTEFGLYCAIPALLVHSLLSRKARGLMASMEQTAVGFLNGLPRKD